MNNKEKICSKCGKSYFLTLYFFNKEKGSQDGFNAICKKCLRKYKANYYKKNKEKICARSNLRYLMHPDKIKEYSKKYYFMNGEMRKEYDAKYRKKNRLKMKKYLREYYIKNKDSILAYHHEYGKNNRGKIREYRYRNRGKIRKQRRERGRRYGKNIDYRILSSLRKRLNKIIKSCGVKKSGHTMDLVGCSIKKLMKHIESKFSCGMSWDNYGHMGWHIDHIRPCVSFNMAYPEEQRKCFRYTNLQPLWWSDNLSKNSWYKGKLYRKGVSYDNCVR